MNKKEAQIKGHNGGEYLLFNISALICMLMVTETFAVCGPGAVDIPVYQMVQYIPQGIFLVLGPFLSYLTYLEPIPENWKIAKFSIIGILFTVSMLTTVEFGIPVLEAEFGSADKQMIIFPMLFYCRIAIALMNLIGHKKKGVNTNDEEQEHIR